ncbi:X-Pro dipeptidyl-peptidase protein [Pyrenophora tritici-repentis]|nr:x-pro dipeptidyl-peptidase protein [Pyrenophora tritici-repentis]KAG9376269.1 x-pro dipeptidyl-peptidase protein [Pyrenophora tritici-repentis]KAI1511872.1 x-pro dipeptidyl-peptidase protein [Pyrenophora tritici-repentis]KAI1536645.1 X-Pro dipeptidyl-peptidase protein [Pyrenophora tritici-repentis]PWO23086.1 alphabeta hydrolase fold-3 domain-containing protein [Pyrenophora tritici-repentis]
MITGRHGLPFLYKEEVEIQRSFLDAFLKSDDRVGWSVKGKLPPVDIVLRKGDVGFDNAEKEKAYKRRTENEWLIAPLGTLDNPKLLQFTTAPFDEEIEITGHIVAHLNVSLSPYATGATPSDIDLFLTLRYISPEGKEVHYTGTAGDPIPLVKGWLRVSFRNTNPNHPKHREYLPWRDYFSTDVRPVIPGDIYSVDVEVCPTNVVVEKGSKIVFEVSSGDTQGSGIFQHNHPQDGSEEVFAGFNHLHFGEKFVNYVTLPIVPPK